MGVGTLLTREEFLALPDADDYELIDGELRETTMGAEASHSAARLIYRLIGWDPDQLLGTLFSDNVGLDIFGGRSYVPKPDVCWISRSRLGGPLPGTDLPVPPELACEVVSPSNRAADVLRKIHRYLDAGNEEVWVVYPEERSIHIYGREGWIRELRGGDTLVSELLPGFTAPVASLFRPID